MKVKKILAFILAVTILCSMLPVAAADGFTRTKSWSDTLFTDVAKADWFYENVKEAYELGLMVGYGDGTFNPTGNITMAQTIAVAARVHAIATKGEESFEQGNPWYQVYVDYALANGILGAAAADYDKAATRLEFARILAKAMPEKDLQAINDVKYGDIPDVANDESVYMLYRAGVLMGNDEKGTFAPESTIQRSEMAAIVTRMALPELRIEKETEKKPTSGNHGNIVIRPDDGVDAPEQPAPDQEDVKVTVAVENENGAVKNEVSLEGETVKATVPAGVALEEGAKELTLTIDALDQTGSDVTAGENEALTSYDVHIAGVSADNTVVITVSMGEILSKGLNMGNVALYHVEDGVTNAMTQVNTLSDLDEHNEFYYDPATGEVTVALKSFSEITVVNEPSKWEGNFDYSWYTNAVAPVDGEATTEYIIANADQLAAFGAIVGGMNGQKQDSFAGKTIKLISDINLGDAEKENNPDIIFYPIGYNSDDGKYEKTGVAVTTGFYNFCGTFDGNGHTIANFYQNTWEMKGDHNWYDATLQYYRDGMGLFGKVYGGTVKNLTIANFSSDGEITTTGCVAAYADGATFENIAIFNCNPRVYNIGNGGIVGCVGWYAKEADLKTTFKNITVDNSNKISALWGSYDVACGGLVGQYYPTSGQTSAGTPKNAGIHMENCHVSAIMDVYNDVCANYQYYAYRYTGILIGSVRENVTIDGHSYPKMDGITAKDCTVHFGTWNDYYYCEIIDNTTASYTHDYQMSRLVEIKEIDGTTITYLDGTTGTVPASGRANYVIVDYTKGHGTENATCFHFTDGAVWTHDMGGIQTGIDENGDGKDDLKEDKQHIYLEFNNLVTGYGWGVTSKGIGDLEGVTILDRVEGNSVEKFKGKVNTLANATKFKLSDIFEFVNNGVKVVPGALVVSVTNLDESNPISAEITYDKSNWENGTLTLTGTGEVKITIQDYYFCTPTTIDVTVTERQAAVKFETKFTGDFLYRVGNQNAVKLDSLFKAKDGADIGNVSVTIETITGASGSYTSNDTWTNGTIQFSGTGVVKVTITDNDYCTPTVLYLEVVDAKNITSATGSNGADVVLLNDVKISANGTVHYTNCTVYGNGFTFDIRGGMNQYNSKQGHGIIIINNATLDHLRIEGDVYDEYGMYTADFSGTPMNDYTGAVDATNSIIQNCYIANCAAPIRSNGNTIIDTTLYGGTIANLMISGGTNVLTNVTTVNYNDGRGVIGMGIVITDGASVETTKLILNGYLKQHNYVYKTDVDEISLDEAKSVFNSMFDAQFSAYHIGSNPKAVNTGIISINGEINFDSSVFTDNANTGYLINNDAEVTIASQLGEATVNAAIASVSASGSVDNDYVDKGNVQGDYLPTFTFNLGDQMLAKDNEDDTSYLIGDANGLSAMYTKGEDPLTLDLNQLATVTKYTDVSYPVTAKCVGPDGTEQTGTVTLNTKGTYTLVFTADDNVFYNQGGNKIDKSVTRTYEVPLVLDIYEKSVADAAMTISANELTGEYVNVSGDYKYKIYPMEAITSIMDDANKDGDLEPFDHMSSISSATISSVGNNAFSGNTTVTVTYSAGQVLTIVLGVPSGLSSPSSENGGKTLSVYTDSKKGIYVQSDGKTTAKDGTWPILSWSFKGTSGKEITKNTEVIINFKDPGCFIAGTLITLADGTQKLVENLVVGDMVLTFNHISGQFEAAPIIFNNHVDNAEEREYDVLHLAFSNGEEVEIVKSHGLFDMTLMQYVYVDYDNYQDFIGHEFYYAGNDGTLSETVVLEDAFIEKELTRIFCPVSYFHMNSIANGFLNTPNIPGDITGLVNYFEYDADLKYNEEAMQRDIETYGLYTYDDFKDYISYEAYLSSPAVHLKVSVGKGMITFDQILDVIDYLLAGSLIQ